jgi:serine/threonine protein kinase
MTHGGVLDMPLQAGDIIGSYKIVGVLGKGGMATVYNAYHERLDRHVAVKLMHETFLQDEDFHARFEREARIVAKLEHPNIVPIYDFNFHENVPYLVMKYVAGMTLKERAIKTGLTLEETRDLLLRVASALDYAHEQGILHRDMKPSNILIDKNDAPYITDFGLARIAEAGASTISHDMMLGTPFYISPEQAQGQKQLDSRTDVYSLAVILYEMITGRVPFQADTPYAIVHGHIYQKPDYPSDVNAELPLAVDDVVMRGLAKDPQDRYDTATMLIEAFADALASAPDDSNAVEIQSFAIDADDAESVYDDLGADVLSQGRRVKPIRPSRQPTPTPAIPAPDRKNRADATFEMNDISAWGDRIRDGVNSLAEMIEERIDTELRQRRGIALTEEELARRRAIKKLKARQEFIGNLSSYILVNCVLLVIWFLTGAGFFWPIFPIFFWGLGVAGAGYEYYSKYGPGSDRTRERLEQEVQRELMRSRGEKPKAEQKRKGAGRRIAVDDLEQDAPRVRLNEEGELTDSFIEEQSRR